MNAYHAFRSSIGAFLLLAVLWGGSAQVSGQQVDSRELRPLLLEDYGRWSTIGSVSLSPDGRWMTFSYEPNDGDSRLYLDHRGPRRHPPRVDDRRVS